MFLRMRDEYLEHPGNRPSLSSIPNMAQAGQTKNRFFSHLQLG